MFVLDTEDMHVDVDIESLVMAIVLNARLNNPDALLLGDNVFVFVGRGLWLRRGDGRRLTPAFGNSLMLASGWKVNEWLKQIKISKEALKKATKK